MKAIAWTALALCAIVARLVPGVARGMRALAVAACVGLWIISSSAAWRLATVDLPA